MRKEKIAKGVEQLENKKKKKHKRTKKDVLEIKIYTNSSSFGSLNYDYWIYTLSL